MNCSIILYSSVVIVIVLIKFDRGEQTVYHLRTKINSSALCSHVNRIIAGNCQFMQSYKQPKQTGSVGSGDDTGAYKSKRI